MDDELDAGSLAAWADEVLAGQRGERGVDVPCGTCTACCRSSYFIHIEPDETATLARIPAELRFPAPGRPPGHVVLGYDERGHCPMLVDGGCSIYDVRPRACRRYDCRVFAATGLSAADDGKPIIDAQARRWRFEVSEPDDVRVRDALARAVVSVRRRTDAPSSSGELAMAALHAHRSAVDD